MNDVWFHPSSQHREHRHSHLARLLCLVLITSMFVIGYSRAASGAPGDSVLVSASSTGAQGNGSSWSPAISSDGRYVAFDSFSGNLVPGDTNNARDVFVKDLTTGLITRVSVSSSGTEGNGSSYVYASSISSDGRFVSFISAASNLVTGDTNATYDAFVHDRVTGSTERISVDSSDVQANYGTWLVVISGDGNFAAFASSADNLVSGDTNSRDDIFLRDLTNDLTTRVSVSSSGVQANWGSPEFNIAISHAGEVVAFDSRATNLVSGDTNVAADIFVHTRATGETIRASVSTSGGQSSMRNWMPALSADGNLLAFSSHEPFDAADDNFSWDIYVRDLEAETTTWVSDLPHELDWDDLESETIYYDAHTPSFSPDGRFIAWEEYSFDVSDKVVVYDRTNNSFAFVSAPGGTESNGDSYHPSLSNNGQYVAFTSKASNLTGSDTNGDWDIFRHEVDPSAFVQEIEVPDPKLFGHRRSGGYANDPVNTATGNFVQTNLDLGFPDQISGLAWTRTYNSRNSVTGTMGAGWTVGLSTRVEGSSSSGPVTYTAWDGRRAAFQPNGSGGYLRPEEFFGDLTKQPDGTLNIELDQGTTEEFDLSGLLATQTFWDGQSLNFSYSSGNLSGVTSSVGYSLAISYDASSRVSGVSSSDGRAVTYTYGTNGALSAVTDPAGGVTTYETDPAGRITRITDPDGKLVIANVYDDNSRVISQTTPSGDAVTFAYNHGDKSTSVTTGESGAVALYKHDGDGRLISVTDPLGSVVTKTYDTTGNLTSMVDRRGEAVTQTFDSHGNVTSRLGPGASHVTYTYDASDRITSLVDEMGETTSFTYESAERIPSNLIDATGVRSTFTVVDGLVTTATDPDGVQVTMTYDSFRNLSSITDEMGNSVSYTYDSAGNPHTERLPSGRTTTYTYDDARRLQTRTDPAGGVFTQTHTAAGRLSASRDEVGAITTLGYDSAGRLSQMTDPLGNSTSFAYDKDGNVTSITRPGLSTSQFTYDKLGRLKSDADPTGVTKTYGYDADGNPTSNRNAVGERVMTYDSRGRLSTSRDPIGRTTTYTYDAADRLSTVTDPMGAVTEFDYDGLGRLTSKRDARNALWEWRYTPGGRLSEEEKPVGQITTFSYDSVGRLSSMSDPVNNSTSYEYDVDGRLVTVTSAEGLETAFAYDLAGRLSESRNPAGGVSKRFYSPRGEVTATVDETGGASLFLYDLVGNLIKATDPNGGETQFSYDGRGNLVRRTDPKGGVELYSYDLSDRPVSQTDPLGRSSVLEYDPAGRIKQITDASARSVRLSWDAADQLVSRSYIGGSHADFSYDGSGRRTSVQDWTGTTSFSWDLVGNLTGVGYPTGKSFSYGYDLAGNVTGTTYPGGASVAFSYDGRNRLSNLAHSSAGSVTYTYDDDGRLIGENLPQAVSRDYVYSDGWLSSYTEDRSGVDKTTAFTRDLAGRIISEGSGSQGVTYTYDAAGQLTSSNRGGQTTTFTYDAVGNRTEKRKGDSTTSYVYDAAQQILSATRQNGLLQEAVNFSHDGAGRMLSASSLTKSVSMSYDPRGRLAQVATVDPIFGNFTTDRTHDADGRLVGATSSGVTSTLHDSVFTWDLSRAVPQIGAISDGANEREFVYGMGRELLVEGAGSEIFSEDAFGSALKAPGTEDVVQADGYDEFGRPLPQDDGSLLDEIAGLLGDKSATHEPLFGFRGEMSIDGLLHLRARDYSASLGRFTSVDPLPGLPGNVTVANPYPYVDNNPLNLIDPFGLRPISDRDLRSRCNLYELASGCSVSDFHRMTGNQRIHWLSWFQATFNTDGWFNAQKGVLRFATLNRLFRGSDWFSYVDAAILHSISQGMAMFRGLITAGDSAGAFGWMSFFNLQQDARFQDELSLRRAWSTAEQLATDAGTSGARELGFYMHRSLGPMYLATQIYRDTLRQEGSFWPDIVSGVARLGEMMFDVANFVCSWCSNEMDHTLAVLGDAAAEATRFFGKDLDPRQDERLIFYGAQVFYEMGRGEWGTAD